MTSSNKTSFSVAFDVSMLGYIFLNIITFGIYFYFFQHKLNKILKRFDVRPSAEKAANLFKWMLICLFGGLLLQTVGAAAEAPILTIIGVVMSMCSSIINIVWAYEVRSGIRTYCATELRIDYAPNAFFIFFFPGLTLTYAINRIESEVDVQTALR